MQGTTIKLGREWLIGEPLGSGGFGRVWEATSGGIHGAAKFIPKAPGAARELLFVELGGARNVVPIIDSGEHGDDWVIVMPRAEHSLRQHLEASGGLLPLADALSVLRDICDALADLEGRVVHRDLKPENVLLLDGEWCLADFGISRYADASTAPDTRKFALTPEYAAPERWRSERATTATDIYALGVMAYEVLSGRRPFPGPSAEELREQHLHREPPSLTNVPAAVEAVVAECMYKSAEARPGPANVAARLQRAAEAPTSPGLGRLQEANRGEVRRVGDAERRASEARTEAERRQVLADAAGQSFERISSTIHEALVSAAPAADARGGRAGEWTLRIANAELRLASVNRRDRESGWGGWSAPSFDVVAYSSINLRVRGGEGQYEGRSHALWFGDIQEPSQFAWFETAFMFSPLLRRSATQEPFSLDPGEEAAKAVWTGMAEYQVAWPFTPLVIGELDEFIGRWAGWLADAAEGRLMHPHQMPEIPPEGSWRR
jgi:serine/threonine protein kinase